MARSSYWRSECCTTVLSRIDVGQSGFCSGQQQTSKSGTLMLAVRWGIPRSNRRSRCADQRPDHGPGDVRPRYGPVPGQADHAVPEGLHPATQRQAA